MTFDQIESLELARTRNIRDATEDIGRCDWTAQRKELLGRDGGVVEIATRTCTSASR
jgi:hypothetical protein